MTLSFAPTSGGVSRQQISTLIALVLFTFAVILSAPAQSEQSLIKGPFILVDAKSGAVLEHHDARRPWYPASTTKLMTAFVTFRAIQAGHLKLTSPVVMSKNAAGQPPSKIGYKAGTVLTVDNALKIIMVKSANDVSVALAETVGGSVAGFATMMNAEAKRLGMTRSHFNNPHGLPDSGQITTARDMAVLGRALLIEFPQYRGYLAVPSIKVGKRVMKNYNTLMERYPGATGMKTGFICSSGFNLVASAKRGGRELIAVVFGAYNSTDRAERAAGLLNLGFRKRAGLFGRSKLNLNSVASGRGYTSATDMRPIICSNNRPNVTAAMFDEPAFRTSANGTISVNQAASGTHTNLGPKRALGPPIVVTTGGADASLPGQGSNTAIRLAGFPTPKPRPTASGLPAPTTVAAAAVTGSAGTPTVGGAIKRLSPVRAMTSAFAAAPPRQAASQAIQPLAGAGSLTAVVGGQTVNLPRPRPNR